MHAPVPMLRLYLIRMLFLLNFLLLGSDVWPALLGHEGAWEPMRGVAFSFWGALSLLSALGLRYPLGMAPVLLLQLAYKAIWLLAVALPEWPTLRSSGLATAMMVGCVLDLAILPWPYVWQTFVTRRGEPWRPARAGD